MKETFPRKLELPTKIDRIEDAAYFAEKAARDMNFGESDIDDIAIALTEAVSNAMMHGNKHDETKKVIVEICETPEQMVITILDEGGGFDPENVDNPLLPENLLKESGRGIFILKSLMDQVHFSSDGNGTLTTLIKNRNRRKKN